MQNQRVDTKRVRMVILEAIGESCCMSAAREAGLTVIAARDEAIEMCLPLGPRFVEKLTFLTHDSRIDKSDLVQAASMGIVEGVDSFQPRKMHQGRPIDISTHLYFRIRKRVYEEIVSGHWGNMKAPRALAEQFMKGGRGEMTEVDRVVYIHTFLSSVMSPEFADYSMTDAAIRARRGRQHAEELN